MKDEVTSTCQQCGASVYKQHVESGIARYERGKLLCSHCVAEFEHEHDKDGTVEEAYERIEFDNDDDRPDAPAADLSSSRIHGASATTLGVAGAWDDAKFKRPLLPNISGATRCRTFHCKLSEAAVEFMNNQINEWLDHNDKIVVKFSNSTIGNFEGKHTEPNLIVTVFY